MTRHLLSLALALALGAGAAAHSQKEGTTPADGAALSTPPEVIAMRFDAPMRITAISLTDANGAEHGLERSDGMQPVREFEAAPAPLPAGAYTVEWRGLAEDGHVMQGSFSFEVR